MRKRQQGLIVFYEGESHMERLGKEQIQRYLQRIGYTGKMELRVETINQLIRLHLQTVPFENLDVYEEGKVPSLQLDDLYKKIVLRRRGGYCFELNRLFYELLRALGFCVYPVAARVVWQKSFVPPLTHRGTIVTFGEKQYYCDVGYGGPGPCGLLALTEGIQEISGECFFVRMLDYSYWVISRYYKNQYHPMLGVETRRVQEIDFEVMNFYSARSENSGFTKSRVVSQRTENGQLSLNDLQMTIHDGEKTTVLIYETQQEIRECLAQYFHLDCHEK